MKKMQTQDLGNRIATAASENEGCRSGRALARPVVFYDGGCPLCRREIDHYRRQPGAGGIAWVDISRDVETLAGHGLDIDAAMARLHVRDAAGQWQTGAWGFAELWSHLRGYRWLAGGLRALGLLPLLDRLYTPFARWRLRRRCDDACLVRGSGVAGRAADAPGERPATSDT